MSLLTDVLAVVRARYHLRRAESVGARVRVWGRPVVNVWGGRLLVGDRVMIVSTIATSEIAVGPQATLEIGERVYINYGCSIISSQSIRIGPRCSIGTHAIMMDNDFHRLEPERRNERPESRPIVLEENVWLGARVTVLRGVRIGAGSAIGAGSVVTRDIPPRSVAVGLPARVVRSL